MSVVILRPDSTIYNGGTLTGGATLWGVLSDDSDASYVTKAAGSPTDKVGVGTSAKPAGSMLKSVQAYVRIQPQAGTAKADWWFKYGGYTFGATYGYTYSALLTAYGPAVNVGDQAQAFIDGLELHIQSNPAASNSSRFVEGYIGATFALQPSVVVDGPVGAQTTSTVTAAWTHTAGSDGGGQAWYQVKLFSASQYGAGGFNPATSIAYRNSGVVASSAGTSTATGLNEQTYKAYVRTAQSINGVQHWSAWASGAAFSVTLSTAEVDEVNAASLSGGAEIIVDRDTGADAWTGIELQRNEATNVLGDYGRMLTDSGVAGVAVGWVVGTIGTPSATSATRILGSGFPGYQQRLGATLDDGDRYSSTHIYAYPVAPGDLVTIDALVLASGVSTSGALAVTWFAQDPGVGLGGATALSSEYILMNPATLVSVSESWTAPAAARYVAIGFEIFGLTGAVAQVASIHVGEVNLTIGGVGWTDVRGASELTPDTNQVTVYDYEASPDVPIRYRARAVKAGPVVGNWVYTVTAVTWPLTGGVWHKSLTNPAGNVLLDWQNGDAPSPEQDRRQGVWYPAGAANAVTVSGVRQGRSGSWLVRTVTDAEAAKLRALVKEDVILIHAPADYRFPPGYFACGKIREVPFNFRGTVSRNWLIEWVEVDAP